jgi:predicted AlkP superfamily pyrophosphatase or phosphodiesterase
VDDACPPAASSFLVSEFVLMSARAAMVRSRAAAWCAVAILCTLAVSLAACRTARVSQTVADHTVVLISLDGFRWDYLDRPEARHLRTLAARGVRASRLVPSFPTKTFPNHYTLVTGLYPEDHGIAANNMRDSALGTFAIGNSPAARDGRWYRGEPIWVTAEKQGVRSATFFWPGSEAEIAGTRPHWYRRFDDTTSRATRVRQVLQWLQLPAGEAPRLITAYFADVDSDGHRYGPDAPETNAAIARVDSAVGALVAGIEALGASDALVAMDSLDVIDWSPNASIIPKAGREAYVLRALTNAHPHLTVYRKQDLPPRLHYRTGDRVAPVLAVADKGWSIGTSAVGAPKERGAHGYDNLEPDMGAIFVAAGPRIARGRTLPAFTNVHVYPLLAHLLQLTPATTAGTLDSVRAALR